MEMIFLKLLNRSISAGWLILAVLLLRLPLKKVPRWITCILWGLVAVRLVCPISVESVLSLIPSAEVFNARNIQNETPQIHTGIEVLNGVINPVLEDSFAPAVGDSVNPLYVWTFVAGIIWIIGLAVMLAYAAVSFWRLRRSVGETIPLRENIRVGDRVYAPFILGVFRPVVYLPSGLEEEQTEYIIAHERAHLSRRDHWWKPLGFVILAVYWFHPLCWAAYVFLCRDIELACDEKVIGQRESDYKKAYSRALVACGSNHRFVLSCPLAFGEVGVKERVKNVLSYKKPAVWIIAAAVVLCGVVAVCFLTDPAEKKIDQAADTGTSDVSISEKANLADPAGTTNEVEAMNEGTVAENGNASGTDTAETLNYADLAGRTYFSQKAGFGGDFTITLNADGTFTYYEGALSSYIGAGSWTIEEDLLRLEDTGFSSHVRNFYFRTDGRDLVFCADRSDSFLYVEISDGGRFCLRDAGQTSMLYTSEGPVRLRVGDEECLYADLTRGDVAVTAGEVWAYAFYTNSEQVTVTVAPNASSRFCVVKLWTCANPSDYIQIYEMDSSAGAVTFRGLTSGELYRVSVEGISEDAGITVSGGCGKKNCFSSPERV